MSIKNKVKNAAAKVAKAVSKAAANVASASESIKLTAKTWKADLTRVLESTLWVHDQTRADVLERLLETDSTNRSVSKTGVVLLRGNRGTVARHVEYAADGAMRFVVHGSATGWFKESDVAIAGLTFEHYASAEALAKTFTVFRMRKASGSSESYIAGMENDLSKSVYSASVRRLSNGKLLAHHEEDKRNAYNAHEVSAAEKEAARSALLNGAKKATVRAKVAA